MKKNTKVRPSASPTLPPRLIAGDTIHLIAPASPPLQSDVARRFEKMLNTLGFHVLLGRSVEKRNGFLAGSDKQRLADVESALASPKSKAVICIRGGYGCGRIIPDLKLPKFKAQSKIFVGCSDITALHCAIGKATNVITFHGPMPQSLIESECPEFTWAHLLRMLLGGNGSLGSICEGYEHYSETTYSLRKGVVTGRLVGGNLSVLCSLLGTPFFPDLAGKILFLEDLSEMPYRIDRCLTQLLNAGVLHGVAGFALGLFKDCEYPAQKPGSATFYRQSLRDVFIDRLKPLGKPIVVGLPFGHTPHNATIPCGGLATLDGNRADLRIEELPVQ